MRSFSFLFLFLSTSILSVSAQSLKHVQGELLIQLEQSEDLRFVQSKYATKYDVAITNIVSAPFEIYRLNFDFNIVDENKLLKDLRKDDKIKYAQFNHLIEERVIPNDTRFDEQWQYLQLVSPGGISDADIDADLAWDISTGGLTATGDTIVACIIDDGFDNDHEDFGDNVWFNYAEIPDNEIDDDGNGYIDDFYGWNVYDESSEVYIDGSHGTPVTGIIGAQGNNNLGVTGVNWDVKLMIVRGGGNEANALASYAYPYYFRKLYNETNGAQGAFVVVTNASWGTDYGNPDDAPIWCNFYDTLGEEGILSCGATANIGINIDEEGDLPTGCSSDYLIAVTNMNIDDEKVNSAGYGIETIDLGAFGQGTFTTDGNNGYGGFGGTSGATPHVAGTIALMYSAPCTSFAEVAKQDPSLAATLAKDYLLFGVDPNESLEGITVTGGRLNVNNAMQTLMANCSGCPIASNLEFSDSDLDGFTLSWLEDNENTGMNLRYQTDMDTVWTVIENVTSPFTFTDIQNCALYDVQLQSLCDTTTNVFFGSYQFETEGCCEYALLDSLEFVIVGGYGVDVQLPDVLAADEYILEYKSANEEEWIIINQGSDNNVLLENLESCTRYEFRSQLKCSDQLTNYYYFEDFTTNCAACGDLAYCEGPGADSEFEWIESVSFAEELYQTGGVEDQEGYQNLLGIKTWNFRQEQYIDLVLTPGFQNSVYDESWKVWLDYDQDGIFNDEEELAYQSEGLSDSINIGQFKIPADAQIGLTRMRIIMCYNGETISCGDNNYEYGETEDYCVYIDEKSGINSPRLYNIKMFPNPTSDDFSLTNVFEEGEFQLYSSSGQLLMSRSLSGKGNYNFTLGEDYKAGVYLAVYQTKEGSWTERLIKI